MLHLYDVVSDNEIDLEGLISRITTSQTRKVQFHFTPDQLLDQVRVISVNESNDVLFIKPSAELSDLPPFCVPVLSHA